MSTIAIYTRGDSLREYLTGATSGGGTQADPTLSLGGYRSSTEAKSYGATITSPIANLSIDLASGGNPGGTGILSALNSTDLTWQPSGFSSPGAVGTISGGSGLVEALVSPGAYLRVLSAGAFSVGSSMIALSPLAENFFGFPTLSVSDASAGVSHYRASIVVNASPNTVTNFQRCLSLLGTAQPDDVTRLGASGAGSLVTSGTFADWPASGWCQIRNSLGVLRETVYYGSRTNTTLSIPAAGRALLGTVASAGAVGDTLSPTPGIAIALAASGVQSGGSSIATIANANTAPAGVTWNQGITPAGGLQVASIAAGQQFGVWFWRQCPPGTVSTPSAITSVSDSFTAA